MTMRPGTRPFRLHFGFAVAAVSSLALLSSESARACSVCFGGSAGDNPDAAGLNLGISLLLGLVLLIQACALFFLWRVAQRGRGEEYDGARPALATVATMGTSHQCVQPRLSASPGASDP